jgi:hypothetical protein
MRHIKREYICLLRKRKNRKRRVTVNLCAKIRNMRHNLATNQKCSVDIYNTLSPESEEFHRLNE